MENVNSSDSTANNEIQMLSNEVISLQNKNIEIGIQSQELAQQLKEISNYNSTLGIDLYHLDQELINLEEKLEEKQSQIKSLEEEADQFTKQANNCKEALLSDSEFSPYLKKLRNFQKIHSSSSSSLEKLKHIVGKPKFSMLDCALHIVQEKVQFLYNSNSDLQQQISLLLDLLHNKNISDFDLDINMMRELSIRKFGWLGTDHVSHARTLPHSSSHNMNISNKSQQNTFQINSNENLTHCNSTLNDKIKTNKKITSNERKNSDVTDKQMKSQHNKEMKRNYSKTFPNENIQNRKQIYEKELTKENNKHNETSETKQQNVTHRTSSTNNFSLLYKCKKSRETGEKVLSRRSRVRNEEGEEYEYEYGYDELSDGETIRSRRRVPVQMNEMEPIYINEFEDVNDRNSNEFVRVHIVESSKGITYEDTESVDPLTGKRIITRREIGTNNEYKYKEKKKGNETVLIRHSKVMFDSDNEQEYEYEYEYESDNEYIRSKQAINSSDEEIESINKDKKLKNMKQSNEIKSEKVKNQNSKIRNINESESEYNESESNETKPKRKVMNANNEMSDSEAQITSNVSTEYSSDSSDGEAFVRSKNQSLSQLIPKLREEKEQISKEELISQLSQVQKQTNERMKMYKELKQRNETLRNNIQHPNSHVTLQMSKVFRTTISAVPNPIEVFKLKQYNYSNSSTQTEVTGETIRYQQTLIHDQEAERVHAEELRTSVNAMHSDIVSLHKQIEETQHEKRT
ncbi:hypothetical protein GPJ56_009918 [Histomonas meleagridis]|nr:hypothetical protein GPJ56_009918 [Histomonas meleagridis]